MDPSTPQATGPGMQASRNSLERSNPDAGRTMQDWEQRNTVDQLKLSLFQLADFLNSFESSTKFKLAQLNEKRDRVERHVTHAETAIASAVASFTAAQ